MTAANRNKASVLLDELTFGGHSQDGAVSMLAEALDTAGEAAVAHLSEEYAVRNPDSGWIYALPRITPGWLDGKRGTREAAEWHLRHLAGPDPRDQSFLEIVRRRVSQWEVAE